MTDRRDFTECGELDEIVATRGAHLERIGKNQWFLVLGHADGSSTALWFSSRDLKKPLWEERKP